MRKIIILILICYFSISCTANQKYLNALENSVEKSLSTNIDLSKKEKVKVAIFDEVNSKKISYENYELDETNFKNTSTNISHGEKVALNILNFSKNVDVKLNNVDINSRENLSQNTKRYIDDGYKLFNFSFSVVALTEKFKESEENKHYNTGLNNMEGIFNNFKPSDDIATVIAAGNTIKGLSSKNPDFNEAIKTPTVTFPAAYPLIDKNYSKNIIAAIGIIPEYYIAYENFNERVLNIKAENIDENIKFYDDNMNYYMYKSNEGFYFSKASKSRLWSMAANATGVFKSDLNKTDFDVESLGSSFSAPKILATLAEVKYKFPFLTNKQAKSVVLSTANRSSFDGLSEYIGWGILDVDKALKGPSNFNKALVKNDSINETLSENYKYFVVNIPDGEYTFSNDIYGSIKRPNNIDTYTEDELDVFVDSGLKKLGNGKLILNGEQKYNEPILLKEGTLEINNNVLNDVLSYSNLEFTNKIKENISVGSIFLNSSNMTTNVNLDVLKDLKVDKLSKVEIIDSNIKTKNLELDNLNSINTNYITEKKDLISFDKINKELKSSKRNFIEYKVEGNNVIAERIENAELSSEPINTLIKEIDEKIKNDETVEDKTLNEVTSIINSENVNEIIKESANIYISSNIALFDTLNLINRQVNSNETLYYKDNISFDFNYLNSKYKNNYSVMKNNIFGTSFNFSKSVNSKYLTGVRITYNKNITEYENIYDRLESDFINITQYNKIIFPDFRYRINATLGYAKENATRNKNINSSVNNYVFSLDNSLEMKTPVVKPYIGIRYDLIFKESIKENGDGLKFEIDGNNFSKTKIYLGANTRTTLGKININIFFEGSYNILKRVNNLNAKYANFNSNVNLTGFTPSSFDYEVGIDASLKVTENTAVLLNLTKTLHTNMMKLGFEYRY